MAGHQKWSKLKRLKGALDAKREQLFSRLAREIHLGARNGGRNPDSSPRAGFSAKRRHAFCTGEAPYPSRTARRAKLLNGIKG